jgi:hypothetical protein
MARRDRQSYSCGKTNIVVLLYRALPVPIEAANGDTSYPRVKLMPQFWIAIFFILLAVAELYQSVKEIALPFPAYLVLGTLLAVASNYQYKAKIGTLHSVPRPEVKVADPSLSSSQLPSLPTAASAADLADSVASTERV